MNEPQVTVLYYTSNTEEEPFASRIREYILKYKGDLPLISVSQKPLKDFGINICVGEHDNCYYNLFRQIQIGLQAVKTPFVLHAEADFLYPPEYFTFVPPKLVPYKYDNVWIHYTNPNSSPRFHFKRHSEGAGIYPTQLWLDRLNHFFKDKEMWSKKTVPLFSHHIPFKDNFDYIWNGRPAISFKTNNGVSKYTGLYKGVNSTRRLPFWGKASKVRKGMLG